jgi:hypothetical protein
MVDVFVVDNALRFAGKSSFAQDETQQSTFRC